MSRILFTIESDVYELTPTVKQHFRDQITTDRTLDAWFDGPCLYHKFHPPDDNHGVETEWVDVIEVFQTLPEDGRERLREAGATPLINSNKGLYVTESDSAVNLIQNA